MVKPAVFQIVGYQNSGKTTIITKLIQVLCILHLKVATIKHHGHGGSPEHQPQKDSAKHLSSGASAVLVEGDGSIILQVAQPTSSLEEQIKLLSFFEPDVILVEGHKREKYPKLLLIRNHADLPLIDLTTNVRLIVCWEEPLKEMLARQSQIPVFTINDEVMINNLTQTIQQFVQTVAEKN